MNLPRRVILFFLLISGSAAFAEIQTNAMNQGNGIYPLYGKDTVVIRFEYKQSALYHPYTFEVIDSIISLLKRDKEITLSIDGYAYKDEGSDTICYYLSLNRALFIQSYILGRGIDSSRIVSVTAYGKRKAMSQKKDKNGFLVNCRAEIMLIYPLKPEEVKAQDKDEDGIMDVEDKCPNVFGYRDNLGCPDTDFVIVPFEVRRSDFYTSAFSILDSVLLMLNANPSITITIQGHAYKTEGIYKVCEGLANDRAEIVKQYLLSRRFNPSRINSVKGYSSSRPINAGKTPKDIQINSRAEILFTRK